MSERPKKRQRVGPHPFIDIEASIGQEDTDSDSDSDEDVELDDSEELIDAPSTHHSLAQAMQDAQQSDDWDLFLQRAEHRGQKGTYAANGEEEDVTDRAPKEGEYLWEIGCKVGCEELAAFKALSRATHPTNPDVRAKSVIARSTFPGRIFAEVSSFSQARDLAASIPELNIHSIKRLSPEQTLFPLFVTNPFVVNPQTWVRIAGTGKGWKKYRGDISLVVPAEGCLALVVIPRIRWNPGTLRSRPPQRLCLQHEAESTFGPKSISDCDDKGYFKFQGRFFCREGFLVARLLDVDVCRPEDDLPTTSELGLFAQYPLIESATLSRATTRISQRVVKLHDRVKVVIGEYRGLFGRVVHVDNFEVGVYLESQDQVETLASSSVRLTFRTGDEVKITSGIHQGTTGWVVAVYDDTVTILNLEKSLEVCVSRTELEFYSAPFVTTLRSRIAVASSMKEFDPNRVHIGKRVMVVGGIGGNADARHYKSYKGTIKNTNPAGAVWVELDALNQRVIQFVLSDLALLGRDDHTMQVLKPIDGPKTRQIPSDVIVPPPPPEICATPMPSPSEWENLSPTWQPLSRPKHWLEDANLAGIRFKLFQKDDPDTVLEFVEVEGDLARVREFVTTKLIPLDDLCPVRPTAKDQLVTITSGEMRGLVLKVKVYAPPSCNVRQVGKVLRKNESDPSIDLEDLIEIYPPFRHTNRSSTTASLIAK